MPLQLNNNELTNEKRREKIIEFLKYNQGCNKEELVRGVTNIVSKKTVYKILAQLIYENLVRVEKSKPNSRSYKLFLDSENLTILIPYELKQFQKYFIEFVHKLYKIKFNDSSKDNIEIELLKTRSPMFLYSTLIQSCILLSVYYWPKQINNKENLQKLISEVFIIVSSILVSLNDIISKEKTKKDNLKQDEIIFSLSNSHTLNTPIEKITFFFAMSQEFGLQSEYEKVMDRLWRINKDVQYIMYGKLMDYEHTFNFGKDNWGDLMMNHLLSTVEDAELKEDLSKRLLKK